MKEKDIKVFTVNCVWVSYLHTICASSAFIAALIVGCALHYHKIVQNEFYGYPQEWFPSVSAAIGDRYPERSIYQVMIALTSGPRFMLAILSYVITNRPNSRLPFWMFVSGVLRTLTCGGWTYVTSTDDHDWHDIFMIAYIVLTLPWTILNTILSPQGSTVRQLRKIVGTAFFASLVPLVYFFIQHKVHRVPGAYTTYAFFEWALIVLDIGFDSLTHYTFSALEVSFEDEKGVVLQKTELPQRSKNSGVSVFGFVVASINWFVWWSVFTSLGVLIWYFPLWYMGISGYEALLLSILSPILLVVPPIRKLFTKLPQLSYLGTAIAIAAFWSPKPTDRLWWVSLGCAFGSISLAIAFVNQRPVAGFQGASFIVGLLLSAVAKLYLWTNNPIWPVMNSTNGGANTLGLIVAIAGGLLTATGTKISPAAATQRGGSSVISAIGFGGLIFALETWVSDTSLIPLWVWEGYPVRGPTPLPHGLITLVVAAAGLYIGLSRPKLALSNQFLVVGAASFVVIQNLKHWIGFLGGEALVFWLAAVSPAILENAGQHSAWKSFGLGFFVLILFILGETWTVSYAFVPGGPALRERTWLVMGVNTAAVALGVWNARKLPASPVKAVKEATTAAAAATSKLLRIVVGALAIVLTLGTVITVQRLQHIVPAPTHPEVQSLTAGIWTIHFGLDNDMWASETRMMSLIQEMELDVVGLLESDTQRVIGGHRDMTQRMAEELGFYADYGPGPNKHTWGAALLSRFPIVNSTHHLTPSPVGELAPAIHATLDVFGEYVDVFVFHSGQEEDPEDRRQQTKYVTELMHETPRPAILLSYLVTKPKEGNYNTWVSDFSGMHDIDPSDWDRWCEYILYKGLKRTGYARVSRSTITDTELQVGKFVVGQEPDYSNTRIDESEVPEGLRFPAKFRNAGVRGHRYHVFDEPRYFQ